MIGTAIREARLKLKFSLQDLAMLVDCTRAHLCDIEHGRRFPSLALQERLRVALRLPEMDGPDTMVATGQLPRLPTRDEAVKIARVLKVPSNRKATP